MLNQRNPIPISNPPSRDLTDTHVTRQAFLVALVQTSLDDEQKDVFLQTIFELTNDFNIIDLEVVWHHWPAEGPCIIHRHARPEDQTTTQHGHREEPPLVQSCIDQILNFAEKNHFSIIELRKVMD